jgi:hypothetical protein
MPIAVRTYTLPDGALVPGVQVTGWADLRRGSYSVAVIRVR